MILRRNRLMMVGDREAADTMAGKSAAPAAGRLPVRAKPHILHREDIELDPGGRHIVKDLTDDFLVLCAKDPLSEPFGFPDRLLVEQRLCTWGAPQDSTFCITHRARHFDHAAGGNVEARPRKTYASA
jgi:hypothetical protein